MPLDPLFEQRIANALTRHRATAEPKKMCGEVAFMVNGNMSMGGTNKGDPPVRVATECCDEMLRLPGAKPTPMGTRTMPGFFFMDADDVATKPALDKWVEVALAYLSGLPKKFAKTRTIALPKAAKNPTAKAPYKRPVLL